MMAVDLKMEVYTPTWTGLHDNLGLLGFLESQKYVMCRENAFTAGSFSSEYIITDKVLKLLQPENLIWIEGETAGIIEYIHEEADESGPYLTVSGPTLTGLLNNYILWGQYNLKGTAPEIMCKLVGECCVHPTRGDVEKRKIPGLVILDPPSGGDIIQVQRTGSNLLETCEDLGKTYGVAFGIRFNPAVPQMEFWTRWGQNRSIHQSINPHVLYSTELDDVLKSEYTYNSQDYRNVALVGGEGEGADRVYVTVESDVETPDTPTPPPTPPDPPVTEMYTITATVDPASSGKVTGAGRYREGASATLNATPEDGYKFDAWKEDGAIVYSETDYTFSVDKNRDLVAAFKEDKPSRLPDEYTEVEYIQSDGNQYIDTGRKPTSMTVISVDIEPLENASSTAKMFWGSSYIPTSGNGFYFMARWSSDGVGIASGTGSRVASYKAINSDITKRKMAITVDCVNKTASIQGENEITLSNVTSSASMTTAKLLAGPTGTSGIIAKLYSCTIEDASGAMEFVPCTNPNGEAGLYDIVGGSFYGNAGTGAFAAGPAV